LALPIFVITLFTSAFLLFIVQPMIGKMILPVLGGTPQVWNTCMVFFQSVLLLGYFYTHATTTYLKPRVQMMLHGALLVVPLIMLLVMGPFSAKGFDPPSGVNPVWSTLFFLAMIVGLPFFVVSTSAPLLQRWFSFSGHRTADDPYFLYGASNFGSLLSLLMYPFFVEPYFYLQQQSAAWIFGYAVLLALCFLSASLVWKRVPETADAPSSTEAADNVMPEPMPAMAPPETQTAIQPSRLVGKRKGLKSPTSAGQTTVPAPTRTKTIARADAYDSATAPITWLRCIRWIFLAAIPSSLMLGVTTYVSTDLSPFPLVWIIPLSLYLLSFILVFAKWPLPWTGMPHMIFLYAMPVTILLLCAMFFFQQYSPVHFTVWGQFLCFFAITMALHGELASDRPAPRGLTLFFLCMSVGGVMGGIFNAIIAPIAFRTVIEYPLAIFAACLLRPNMIPAGWIDGLILGNQGVRDSAAESSDSVAKSFGMRPTGEPFLLSYLVDIGIGLCIAVLVAVCVNFSSVFAEGFFNVLRFLGVSDQTIARNQQGLYILGVYGLGMLACLIVMPRSLRFALGIGALLFMFNYSHERRGQLYATRSYFGVLRVLSDDELIRDPNGRALWDEAELLPVDFGTKTREGTVTKYNYLMHGSTYHGRSYQEDQLARLATTYYHRFGPVGAVTEKYNWLPGRQNSYLADIRMPITMIGQGALSAVPGSLLPLPTAQLVNAWSEPPFATVGLGTGTMASYGRWLQHVAYYEIDEKIREFNLPSNPNKPPFFRTVYDALNLRQANVEIIMGDARQSLQKEDTRAQEWEKKLKEAESIKDSDKRMETLAALGPTPHRQNYYKWLNLDAFSSDAIPVHLITEEAIALYMSKLAPDGVLMVHTSNRHLNLPAPVADICRKLKLDAIIGKDSGGSEDVRRRYAGPKRIWSLGHYGSEYVMVARKEYTTKDENGKEVKRPVISIDSLKNAVKPEMRDGQKYLTSVVQWVVARPPGREVWSDHYQDIVSIIRGFGDDE
jgi:hypothetical protein